MTEKEAQLRKERDDLYSQYLAKDKELRDYRNTAESGALKELNEKYAGKIYRVKLMEYGMSPLNTYERTEDFRCIYIEKITHDWGDRLAMHCSVFELLKETTHRNSASHIGDHGFEFGTVNVYHTSQFDLYLNELAEELTEEDLEKIYERFDRHLAGLRDLFSSYVRKSKMENENEGR